MIEKKTLSWLFYGWMALIAAGVIVGIWGAATLIIQGHGPTTGITNQIPYGSFVPTYVFFVAASAGCVIVSLGYALGIKIFELIMKRAVFLAIITLIAGGIVIILDLGGPLRIFNFLLSPNIQSPMWWMIVFYTLYLVLLLVDFYLLSKQQIKKARIISVIAALSAIAVHSTLGAIFGFAAVRTYFGGAMAPVYFILIALVIGTALLVLVTILQFKVTKKEMSQEFHGLIINLGKFLGWALAIVAFFTIWKVSTGLFSHIVTTAEAYRYMLFGPAAWWYWTIVIGIGLVAPLLLIINRGTRTPNGILAASALVLIGMFAARIEFTLGGQVVALTENLQHLQWPFASYTATLTEAAVVILAFAVPALLYTWGSMKLALEEIPRHA